MSDGESDLERTNDARIELFTKELLHEHIKEPLESFQGNKTLSLSGLGIKKMEDLTEFPQLTRLDVSTNYLESLRVCWILLSSSSLVHLCLYEPHNSQRIAQQSLRKRFERNRHIGSLNSFECKYDHVIVHVIVSRLQPYQEDSPFRLWGITTSQSIVFS